MEDLLEVAPDTPEVPLEEGLETPETPEIVEPETPTEETGDKQPVTSLFQADGKKLDPQVSATLANIKKENPSLGKLLSSAVYRVAALDREFPGGITEVKELRDKVEELGGVDRIEEEFKNLEWFEGLDTAFTSGDASFVEELANADADAFTAIAPAVFNKLSQINPEAFSAYMGRVIMNDMQANEIPLLLMRFQDLIPPENAKLVDAFSRLSGYLSGFKALAEKPLKTPQTRASAPKSDDFEKREEALRSKEWQSDYDRDHKAAVNAEFTKCLAGRKPNSEEKAQILELFLSRSKSAAQKQFPKGAETIDRYIRNKDKSGYLRFMKSIDSRIVPEAMASAVRSTMKGQRASAPPVKKVAGATQASAPAPGFKPVSKEPDTWNVDYSQTTPDMVRNNRAVLRDGTKVSWK